jgi:1-acyl-sn-glycerol-3-phosphate acyltransferase
MAGRIRTVLVLAFAAAVTLLLAPVQWFGVKTGLYSGNAILRSWHRSIAITLGLRIRVFGTMAKDRPLMIAANHISWTDITVLGAIADISFIAKSEMAAWPVIGWLATMQGSIFIDRDSKRKSGEQARQIAARLAEGDVMVLFAEGTTGDGNRMLPFKSSLFGAAGLMLSGDHDEVYIQPVAIAYTRLHGVPLGRRHRPIAAWIGDQDLVGHIVDLLRNAAIDVEVHFGEPIAFSAQTSRKETARLAEDRVNAMLQAALARPA